MYVFLPGLVSVLDQQDCMTLQPFWLLQSSELLVLPFGMVSSADLSMLVLMYFHFSVLLMS